MRKWTYWNIGNGKNVYIRIYPYIGDNGSYELPVETLEILTIKSKGHGHLILKVDIGLSLDILGYLENGTLYGIII